MALTWPPPVPNGVYSIRVYETGTATANFGDHLYSFSHPSDLNKQAWSYAIRIKAASANLEFSFDGTTVHGSVAAGDTKEFEGRFEGGIAIRGAGSVFTLEAW